MGKALERPSTRGAMPLPWSRRLGHYSLVAFPSTCCPTAQLADNSGGLDFSPPLGSTDEVAVAVPMMEDAGGGQSRKY